MAKTNPARSPKRIRRWLQTTAMGTMLVSSSLFGLIAVQGASATAHDSGVEVQAPSFWSRLALPGTTTPTPAATTVAATPVAPHVPVATTTSAATVTAAPVKPLAPTATPTVRARTRAS